MFRTEQEYEENELAWHDIIVMAKVPENIPRLTDVVNAEHATPLSHTNVLASGWGIPNAIQLQALDTLAHLNGRWVRYTVDPNATEIGIEPIGRPETTTPDWLATRITMDEPDLDNDEIADLKDLRWRDSTRYGTKAANLGELNEVAKNGSTRWLGFYRIPRPPRENLLPYLEQLLDEGAKNLFRDHIRIPRGIALPFSPHRRFLEASPRLQQAVGKLKLALELDAPQTDAQCVELQHLIRTAKFPDALLTEIDDAIIRHLAGVSTFVVRSSSNAEDLAGFSAAGIYESVTHVSDARGILSSIKRVWASLVNARGTRLRKQAGISLDDAYMGMIIQEQVCRRPAAA